MAKKILKDFWVRFYNSPEFKNEKEIFDKLNQVGSIWWLLDKNSKVINLKYIYNNPRICKKLSSKLNKACLGRFEAISKQLSPGQIKHFECPAGLPAVLIPYYLNNELIFTLCICHSKKKISKNLLELLRETLGLLYQKIEKEQSLNELYETIRPRAIALSTVHTVHRLIGSILNIDELLPRIARLCLQVLRAKRCSIMLLDKDSRTLIPKAIVDIRKKEIPLPGRIPLGKSIEGKVVKSGKIYLNLQRLCVPLIDEDVVGVISIESKQDNEPFNIFDQEILSVLAEQAVIAIKNAQLYEERGKIILGTVKSLATLLDIRSPETYTHPVGFVEIVLEIGKELKLSEENIESLRYAALLLDAGKIGIPDEILKKPAKLTGIEYRIVKEHPIKGAEIVQSIEALKPALPIILHHHERFDGTGYPMRLKKEEIPLGARIIAVADAFEAMICKRPYRGGMSIKQAVEEIEKGRGTQFDPLVVDAFLNLVKKGEIKNIICQLQTRLS